MIIIKSDLYHDDRMLSDSDWIEDLSVNNNVIQNDHTMAQVSGSH